MRRNREERLKSAHSSKRNGKQPVDDQNPNNHTKYLSTKTSTNRIAPKVYGKTDRTDKYKSKALGQGKINEMLNQKDSVDLQNKKSTQLQIPYPDNKDYLKPQDCHSFYGPLLTSKTFKHKNSFIEIDNSGLHMSDNSDNQQESKINPESTKTNTKNIKISNSGTKSSYFFKTGLSCKNTTISDKNSDHDK